jgi:endonuclease III
MMAAMTLSLPVDADANELLSRNPLALLIGMLLDQQVPLEKAFSSPLELVKRLGHEPTAAELAEYDPEALAARTQDLARQIVDRYDGDPAAVWTGAATGKDLVARIAELPGFGGYKAQIFAALLGKQLGVQPDGWREAAGHFGQNGSHYSVADIVDDDSLAEVRAYKKGMKAAAKAKSAP